MLTSAPPSCSAGAGGGMRLPVLCGSALCAWMCNLCGQPWLCLSGTYSESQYILSLKGHPQGSLGPTCVVPTGNTSSGWLLFGAEDAEPSQPLSGCHIWHNAFFSNSNLFKIQPLQFAVRIWQYFHSRELQSCQKADKRKRNNTPADIEMIFHEFIPH